MTSSFGFLFFKLFHPSFVLAVHRNVQLLQHREHGARRAPNEHLRLVVNHNLPTPVSILLLIEVEAISKIQAGTRNQSKLDGQLVHARRREHFHDIGAFDNLVEN